MKMPTTLMSSRPESRHRGGTDETAWADTVPLLFRSEGFAEDLGGLLSDASALAATRASPLARAGALLRTVMLGAVVPPGHAERVSTAHGQPSRP